MKQQLHNLEKGDDLEVRMATHDGYLWHSAVITYIDRDFIHIKYASGHAMKIARNEREKYRRPKAKSYG